MTDHRAPADVDPDEALAKVLEDVDLSGVPGGYLPLARAAREHIEAEGEHAAIVREAEADLARDTERAEQVRANDPILRAWVEPGINPPYHERMKARVRKIMPTLARHLDEKAKGTR